MFSWLHKLAPTKSPGPGNLPTQAEAVSQLRWVEADDNSYRLRVLDCRPVTQGLMSVSAAPEEVERFTKLCESDGSQYRGASLAHTTRIDCDLHYPYGRAELPPDGPVFVAKAMEDKWNVYLFENYLYFVRSFDGRLVFRAEADFALTGVSVSGIEADTQESLHEDIAVAQVDYLIKSHIYNSGVPHPLPKDLPDDEEGIAIYSFEMYGRRAVFATYEDPTTVDIEDI